uniref:PtpC protein n=1 Tax=Fopius arisanus TaxID=64838 RepID=A0A0C9R7U7_9HYME
MTTTTGEPSTLKNPSTLSGGDLVSRLLAATPPYLYNVPLTPHSFFFSEMLRSFVQAKSETATTSTAPTPVNRRRKRSWRDARDRPLELTTKEKTHESHSEKYFHQDLTENRFKPEAFESELKPPGYEENKNFNDVLKPPDESPTDFVKQPRNFYDDSSRLFGADRITHEIFPSQKIKPEEQMTPPNDRKYEERQKINPELSFSQEPKNKLDFSARNFVPGLGSRPEELSGTPKNFLPPAVPNPDFLPSPLWYPPYPLPQSYPGIDPLHFFIDLRVSGHIWDRKLSERQAPFKSKHCSAFSVPQAKEFNRPLNLTRDEASTSKKSQENSRGTHFILKNLMRTYKGIKDVAIRAREDKGRDQRDCESVDDASKEDAMLSPSCHDEDNRKDIRALIGLELVVDYVKEPKEEPAQSPKTE